MDLRDSPAALPGKIQQRIFKFKVNDRQKGNHIVEFLYSRGGEKAVGKEFFNIYVLKAIKPKNGLPD